MTYCASAACQPRPGAPPSRVNAREKHLILIKRVITLRPNSPNGREKSMISNKPGMNPQLSNHNFREKCLLSNNHGMVTEPIQPDVPAGDPPKPPEPIPQHQEEKDPVKPGVPKGSDGPLERKLQGAIASNPKPGQEAIPRHDPKSDAQQHQQKSGGGQRSGHGQQPGTKPQGPRK